MRESIKREIENFIIYFTSDDKEREDMMKSLEDYEKGEDDRNDTTKNIVIEFDTKEIDELMALEGIKGFELSWAKDVRVE